MVHLAPPMIEAEGTIAAPPAKVFAALADYENAVKWMPGLVSSTVTTKGPTGAGTEFHQERKVMQNKIDNVDVKVLTHSPPSTLVLDVHRNGKQTAIVTWTVTSTGTQSLVCCSLDLKMNALMAKLWGAMIRKQIAGDIAGLKDYVENGK